VYVGSYDLVLSTYQSLGGPDMTSSQVGLTDTPCLGNTSSLGVHPYEASRGLLHSYVPATGTSHHRGCSGHTLPARLVPRTHHRILSGRLNPHHTPKTHAKISPSYYHIIGTECHSHPQTILHQVSHHRYNA